MNKLIKDFTIIVIIFLINHDKTVLVCSALVINFIYDVFYNTVLEFVLEILASSSCSGEATTLLTFLPPF